MTKKRKALLIAEIVLSAIILIMSIVLLVLMFNAGKEEAQGEVQLPPATESTVTLPPSIEEETGDGDGEIKTDVSLDASAIVRNPDPEVTDTQINYVTKEEPQ